MGLAKFKSLTLRCFKLPRLEDRCEEFGQFATYLGTLQETPGAFTLDQTHTFEAGRAMAVCGNTALMLTDTRFAPHFRVVGDTSVHYGLFLGPSCAPPAAKDADGFPTGCC